MERLRNELTPVRYEVDETDRTRRGTVRFAMSREGVCRVEGCKNPIKARKLCDMHYARILRNGRMETKITRFHTKPDQCLVIGCERPYDSSGYCSTHKSYNQKYGTPYTAKIIKLCGVEGCYEKHEAKGLCNKHYQKWIKELKKYTHKENG